MTKARSEGPDFIGVGVQKCGTTWVARRLAEHPEVYFDRKEISFFTNHFNKGYGWYEEHFANRHGRKAGEISPNYWISPRPNSSNLEHYPRWSLQSTFKHIIHRYPAARDEISERYPNAKVFVMFRNPADRAWSHYWMWVERRKKRGKDRLVVPFEEFFLDNGRWVQLTGRYATLLKYWREKFPDIGVFLYDDLVADPKALIQSVYRYIGVDDTFVGKLGNRENSREYEAMPAETRQMLIDHYRPETEEFFRLINRQLPWLK